jgi:hypothetical protein
MKNILLSGCLLAVAVTASPAFAESTFPFTCSEIQFAYAGANATIKAVCLKQDGSPNATSLTLQGISNENGQLKQGGGPATFQKSCGDIRIIVNGPNVLLAAQCRTTAGSSNATSMSLNNISNNNGNLQQ